MLQVPSWDLLVRYRAFSLTSCSCEPIIRKNSIRNCRNTRSPVFEAGVIDVIDEISLSFHNDCSRDNRWLVARHLFTKSSASEYLLHQAISTSSGYKRRQHECCKHLLCNRNSEKIGSFAFSWPATATCMCEGENQKWNQLTQQPSFLLRGFSRLEAGIRNMNLIELNFFLYKRVSSFVFLQLSTWFACHFFFFLYTSFFVCLLPFFFIVLSSFFKVWLHNNANSVCVHLAQERSGALQLTVDINLRRKDKNKWRRNKSKSTTEKYICNLCNCCKIISPSLTCRRIQKKLANSKLEKYIYRYVCRHFNL